MLEPRLPPDLFQQLIQTQRWLLSRALWYACIVYLVTLVFFALLRLFTGVSIKRIGYFSVRHVAWSPAQGVEVRIGRVGLHPHRPTVAQPGYLTFVLGNLEVVVDPREFSSDAGGHVHPPQSPPTDASESECEDDEMQDLLDGVPLAPKRFRRGAAVVRWLLPRIGVFNCVVRSASLVLVGINTTVCTSAQFYLDVRKTRNIKASNFFGTLDGHQLRGEDELPINIKIGLTDIYTAESLQDESPWQLLDDLRFDVTGVLNMSSLKLKNVGSHVHAGRVQLDVSFVQDLLSRLRAMRKEAENAREGPKRDRSRDPGDQPLDEQRPRETEEKRGPLLTENGRRRMLRIANVILHLVNRTQVAIGFVEVFRVPAGDVYLASSIKDVILNLSRMNPLSSGFRLLYEKGDIAHQSIFTAAALNIGLDNGSVQEEVLYIPLITNLSTGNVFSKSLLFAQDAEGSINESNVRSRWTVHAPNISVEYKQIPALVRLLLGDPTVNTPASRRESLETKLKDLQDYFPVLSLQVVISDPALRAVCGKEKTPDAMFVAEAERLDFALRAAHDRSAHGYTAKASFTSQRMRTYYRSAKVPRSHIARTESTEICVDAATAPRLTVSVTGKQTGFFISATHFEIFYAMGLFTQAISSALKEYGNPDCSEPPPPKPPSLLRQMPHWLNSVSLEFERTTATIASDRFRRHTNEVLGVFVKFDTLTLDYHNVPPHDYSTDGRLVLVTGQNLVVAKADKFLIDQNHHERINRIVDLMRCEFSANTHSKSVSELQYNIHPRLRIDLNINLIMAFQVVREVFDVACARSGKRAPPEQQAEKKQIRSDYTYLTQVSSPLMIITIDMPSDDRIMLEVSHGCVEIRDAHVSLRCQALRMYSESPFQKGSWCILMSLAGLVGVFDQHDLGPDDEVILLELQRFKINVPYKFKLYRIIDNGITLAKAIKTLLQQTKEHDPDLVFDPKKIDGVPHIPRTIIRAKEILTALEDDFFESELQLCMATKMHVDPQHTRKIGQFGQRLKQMLQRGRDLALQVESLNHNASHSRTSSRVSNSNDSDNENMFVHAVHRTTQVFSDHHEQHDSVPFSAADRALARAIMHIRKFSRRQSIIEDLLDTEIELGVKDNDSKRLAVGHPWLELWAMDAFAPFRELKVPLRERKDGVVEYGKLTVAEAREALTVDLSRAWVDTMKHARLTQMLGTKLKDTAVCNIELNPETCAEERIVDYTSKPLLMSISLRDITLTLDSTEHNTEEKLHQYLHDIGKGQPLHTEFSILVPMFLDIKAQGGLRVDVRDYPLPLVHFPPLAKHQHAKDKLALHISGNVVICEQLVKSRRSIRQLYIPLRSGVTPGMEHNADILEVRRTLTPIKTFTDLSFKSESTLPTRVAWCMAYKAGFSAVGEAFSGFSKPPIDPSPALGFWDKIRLVFHARLSFYLPKSPLLLVLKCGKSPYDLLGENSGFVFAWRDEVRWKINPNDDPRSLFLVDSNSYELYVPHFASSETLYLRSSPAMRAFPQPLPTFSNADTEKVVFSFAQPTRWRLGMMFEKEGAGGTRDKDFRHHYEVELSMPKFIDDVNNYDAYKGFRSDFIHMAISVISQATSSEDLAGSEGECKCSTHLTPGVIQHFKSWKEQFHSELWPPIRSGSLFPDPVRVRPSTKTFGTALSTAQYQIALAPLDLSFFHHLRHHHVAQHQNRCTGLKAKIEDFVFDWHTRREPPNGQIDDASRRWRMKSYSAEIDLRRVRMKVIDAKIHSESTNDVLRALGEGTIHEDEEDDIDDDDGEEYESDSTAAKSGDGDQTGKPGKSTFVQYIDAKANPIFGPRYIDGDLWADYDDYTEVGLQINPKKPPVVKAVPFLSSPRIFYVRKTDFTHDQHYHGDDGSTMQKFFNPGVHECLMSHTSAEETQSAILEYRLHQVRQKLASLREVNDPLEDENNAQAKEIRIMMDAGTHSLEVLENEKDKFDRGIKHKAYGTDDESSFDCSSDTQDEANADKEEGDDSTYKSTKQEFPSKGTTTPPSSDGEFINKYNFHAVHLRWNNTVRNLLYRLQTSLDEDRELHYVQSRKAVQYLEELVAKAGREANEPAQPRYGSTTDKTAEDEDNVEVFFDELADVEDGKVAKNSHFVRFLSPQIQLVAEENPEQCVQLVARDIELRVIDVYLGDELDDDSSRTERRFGFVLRNAAFFILSLQDVEEGGLEIMCLDHYLTDDEDVLWPPWLAVELCYDFQLMRQYMVVKDVSFAVRFDRPNDFHVADSSEESNTNAPDSPSRASLDSSARSSINTEADGDALMSTLYVHAPCLVVSMDSEQFCALYTIVVDLMTYRDPLARKREEAINKVFLTTDFSGDYQATLSKIEDIQSTIQEISELRDQISLCSMISGNSISARDAQVFFVRLTRKHLMLRTRLTVLMRAFKTSLRRHMRTAETKRTKWLLKASSVVLQVLDNDGSKIAEVLLKSIRYSRITDGDASCTNRVTLGGIYGRNMLNGSSFQDMLASVATESDNNHAIRARWSTMRPVGGISVIEDANVKCKPLRIQLEKEIVEKLLDFVFPIKNRDEEEKPNSDSDSEVSLELVDTEDHFGEGTDDEENDDDEGPAGKKHSGAKSFHKLTKSLSSKRSQASEGKVKKRYFKLLPKGQSSTQYVDKMMDRASNYQSIRHMRVQPVQLIVSYKGHSNYSLLNIRDLRIHMPDILIENKTWTRLDLLMKIKREVLKTLVSQSGSIIGNKLRKPKEFVEPESTKALVEELNEAKPLLEVGSNDLIPYHRLTGSTAQERPKANRMSLKPKRTISRHSESGRSRISLKSGRS